MDKCGTDYQKVQASELREPEPDDPIQVARSGVHAGDYGEKQLRLTYTNKTERLIDGIKFEYSCFNNFGEPVASGRLIDQDRLRPAKSTRSSWPQYDNNCTKVKVALTEVHFADGETWTGK